MHADDGFCRCREWDKEEGKEKEVGIIEECLTVCHSLKLRGMDMTKGEVWTQGKQETGHEVKVKDCKEMKWAWFQSVGAVHGEV